MVMCTAISGQKVKIQPFSGKDSSTAKIHVEKSSQVCYDQVFLRSSTATRTRDCPEKFVFLHESQCCESVSSLCNNKDTKNSKVLVVHTSRTIFMSVHTKFCSQEQKRHDGTCSIISACASAFANVRHYRQNRNAFDANLDGVVKIKLRSSGRGSVQPTSTIFGQSCRTT